MRTYLAADVISSVKRRALLSASGSTPYSDDDWHALMDEEVRGYIWPLLRSVQEDFFVRRYPITVVSGTAEYRLPRRVLGESLAAVLQYDGTSRYLKLNRLRPEEQGRQEVGFWLEDDRLVLSPTPDAAHSQPLRLLYHLRPSKVVAVSRCSKVVSRTGDTINADTGETAGGIVTGDIVDVVMAVPGLRPVVMDQTLSEVDSGPPVQFIVSTTWPTDWALSALEPSYVCRAEETPIPNVPFECFPLLAQRLTVLALEGRSGYAEAKARCDEMKADVTALFANKVEGNDEVLQSYDAPGWRMRRRSGL